MPDLKAESQQTGSHRHFIHPDGRRITVKYHNSGNIFHDPKIIKRMIEDQACWTEADLRRLGLLK
jgi:predicted RNA binding protein YcfA (HicA-like mRNA interferase family)